MLCLDAEDVDKWYARLETGFAGGNMLLQGSALGMGCWFTTELTSIEQGDIQKNNRNGKNGRTACKSVDWICLN